MISTGKNLFPVESASRITWFFITLALVLATAVMIFLFSAQSGDNSSQTSGRVTDIMLDIFRPSWREMPPAERAAIRDTAHHYVRKAAHFTEFAMLGFFLLLHLRTGKHAYAPLWAYGIGTLYAITDEVHQLLVAARAPALTDVLIDSAGVLCGTALAVLLWRCGRKIWKKGRA